MYITPSKIVLSLVAAMSLAVAPAAFASPHHWHGGYHGHDHGHWGGHRFHGGHDRGHYWHRYHDHAGRWIAGAVVLGALAGIVADATAPQPVYDGAPPPPVVYRGYGAPTVVYESNPPVVVEHRVEETRVYNDPDETHFIRDDGWDGRGN